MQDTGGANANYAPRTPTLNHTPRRPDSPQSGQKSRDEHLKEWLDVAQAELLQTQAQLVEKEEECRWLSAQLEQAQGGAQVRVATWSQIICVLVCVCGLKRG